MKKVYIICLIFVLALAVFGISFFYSKNNLGLNNTQTETESESESITFQMKQTAYNTVKITNITEIRMQVYDLNNNTFTEEKISTPVEFLEMEREDLLTFMNAYLNSPDEDDKKRGLIAFELVQFSREEVVLRKTFNKVETSAAKYYGVIENGYVTIYNSDLNTIYDYTDIPAAILPENIKNKLANRIDFQNIKELYEFLETYSS